MRNKVFLIFILVFFGYCNLFAQQRPLHSQYLVNYSLLNPAVSGIDDYADIKMNYRRQWLGIPQGPETMYFTANTHLNKRDRENYIGGVPSPNRNSEKSNYRTKRYLKPHHAMGVIIMRDRAGEFVQTNAEIAYAYHVPLANSMKFAVGATGGVLQYTLNADLETKDIENIEATSLFKPIVSVGAILYSNKFMTGISTHQINRSKLPFTSASEGRMVNHYYAFGTYRLIWNRVFGLEAISLLRFAGPSLPSVDISGKMTFNQKFWVGSSFRPGDAVVAFLGMSFPNRMMVGYSYDYTISQLSAFHGLGGSTGSHEVFFGYNISRNNKVICPQKYW